MAAIPQPGGAGGMVSEFNLATNPPACCSFGPIPQNRWLKYLRFVVGNNNDPDYTPSMNVTVKAFGRNLPTDQTALTADNGGYIVCRSLTIPTPPVDSTLGVGTILTFTMPLPPLPVEYHYVVVLIEVGDTSNARSRGVIFGELESRGPESQPIV